MPQFIFRISYCVVLMAFAAASAQETVVEKFDSGGANSFRTNLNAAASAAGLGLNYFPAADIPAIETAIQTNMSNIYAGFDVNFTTVANAAARSVTFGTAGTAAQGFGVAPFDWRNNFKAASTKTAQIFTNHFAPTLSAAATLAQNEQRIEVGLAGTGAHELGHTFGLDHQDAYGDPGITPANYANTGGIQNTHIMATGSTGLSNNRSTPRAFGQLEKAKLELSDNMTASVPFTINDAGANHNQATLVGPNKAQPITFANLPLSGLSARDISGGSLATPGEIDVYSFSAPAGAPFTADVLSESGTNPAQGFFTSLGATRFPNGSVDTQLTLFRSNGAAVATTVVATSSDTRYNGNVFGGASTLRDLDPFILNVSLPATDTYFLQVSSQGTDTTGNYEMFVSIPEPSAIVLAGIASIGLMIRRRSA